MKNKINLKTTRLESLEQLSSPITPCISNGNSKTGKACFTISMDRDFTCKEMPCYKSCYCAKGRQVYTNVRNGYIKNYLLWSNPSTRDLYKLYIDTQVKCSGLPLVRHFDAGDIPDMGYIDFMNELAVGNPSVQFLCYTKKYDIMNEWLDNNTLANNLCIRFSHWDKEWKVYNPHNLPTAHVSFKDKSMNEVFPKKTIECLNQKDNTKTCSTCKLCFSKNVRAIMFKQH